MNTYGLSESYLNDNRDPLLVLIEKESRGEVSYKLDSVGEALTYQQGKVFDLLRQGYTEKEIADYMYISPSTIRDHMESIRLKVIKEVL